MLKIFHISGLNGRLDRHLTQRRLAGYVEIFVRHEAHWWNGRNPHWLYQGTSEPLGLSKAGRSVLVSSMPLKGTGEGRCAMRRIRHFQYLS
jgi:hypothetical protein